MQSFELAFFREFFDKRSLME